MTRHSDAIRLLLARGPMAARQLTEKTGISQPTVSRTLGSLGDDVIRLKVGKSIHYALRDRARGHVEASIYRVCETGVIQALGTLIPVSPGGFVMHEVEGESAFSDGLPWWLLDMRPQGYLGRAYASTHAAALGLPPNPEHWSDTDVLRALLAQGDDAIGNLLVGEQARDRFVATAAPVPVDRAIAYPELAASATAGDVAGSSAGGEQPKFCAYTAERGHVLVKFTAPDNNPVSERWRDLLLAEHLALKVLDADTEIFDYSGQRFLEVRRFDRIGMFGRLGVFSLRALDAEFVGDATASWPVLVRRLAEGGNVHGDAVAGAMRLWAYGKLIGNSDMHAGNLSFVSGEGRPYRLAPAYDMLPMAFAPRSSGAIVDSLPAAALSSEVDGVIWREALALAEQFYALVSAAEFSPRFTPCLAALRGHIDDATTRIGRLG